MRKDGRGPAKRGEKEIIAAFCDYWADEYGNVFTKTHSEVKQFETTGGYMAFSVEGYTVMTHRFVWHCLVGPIPVDKVIDHIDRCPYNPKLENLRCVSQSENMKNRADPKYWKPRSRKIYL